MRRILSRAAVLAGMSGLAANGQPADPFTLRVDVDIVNVDVSVTDADGRPVNGLGPDDFEILENGIPQPVDYFGPSTAPYNAYVLIDVSGSTRNNREFMQRALSAFVGALAPRDRVSIGAFGESLTPLAGWEAPRSVALSALDHLLGGESASGVTEFYQALEGVIENAFDGVTERQAVIVLTDGRDVSLYRELVERNRLVEVDDDGRFRSVYRAAAEGAPAVYFIAVNTDRNLDVNDAGADEYVNLGIIFGDSPIPELYLEQVRLRMERIADVSGGRVSYPRSLSDAVNLFREIATSLSGAYSLGFAPSYDGAPVRRITVRLPRLPHRIRQSRNEYRVLQ